MILRAKLEVVFKVEKEMIDPTSEFKPTSFINKLKAWFVTSKDGERPE